MREGRSSRYLDARFPQAAVAHASERIWNKRDTAQADRGVWVSALVAGSAALAVPAWVLGGSSLLVRLQSSDGAVALHMHEAFLLLVGALALAFCAHAAFRLGYGRGLSVTAQCLRLRIGAVVTALAMAATLLLSLHGVSSTIPTLLAALCLVLPLVFMADLSSAFSRIGDERVGADAGERGAWMWISVLAVIALMGTGLVPWWSAGPVACAAAVLTASAGLRIWRRYEGEVVMA